MTVGEQRASPGGGLHHRDDFGESLAQRDGPLAFKQRHCPSHDVGRGQDEPEPDGHTGDRQ